MMPSKRVSDGVQQLSRIMTLSGRKTRFITVGRTKFLGKLVATNTIALRKHFASDLLY